MTLITAKAIYHRRERNGKEGFHSEKVCHLVVKIKQAHTCSQ